MNDGSLHSLEHKIIRNKEVGYMATSSLNFLLVVGEHIEAVNADLEEGTLLGEKCLPTLGGEGRGMAVHGLLLRGSGLHPFSWAIIRFGVLLTLLGGHSLILLLISHD